MTDTPERRATFAECRGHLDALAVRLDGFDREIAVSRTGVPILVVTNPDVPVLSDRVLCCYDPDGALVYLWPWGKRIADVTRPDAAAYQVANMLSTHKP